ncbi:MAG: flagellar biosynthesis protein FlhA [Tateyamaria sp.]|nr:flagellar biosynthesis protein FlhA [Tateyamaria sp.]
MQTLNNTATGFSPANFGRSVALPFGILTLMAMMILPLPSFLLDTFFISNIIVSLLVLMVAVNTQRPLDFSSFPNVLLLATVLRLALNVASTRIVLSKGHEGSDAAGRVIEAFGEFVVAGNYAVGIFVFIILVIINLVVITKGAGRVSEVSARFTLDAMPGKQMAIDADLNAGLLSPDEATQRRADIASEADFYGSMDGASKFVKGDAVAGILILVVNIIGGLIIGIAQYQLSFSAAAETYIILAIGDGLVAQIPSLLLSLATAIIVTRVSSNHVMSEQIGNQIGISRAWYPAAAVVAFLALVPGMPTGLFLTFTVLTSGIAMFLQRKELQEIEPAPEEIVASDNHAPSGLIEVSEITEAAKISLLLGYKLVELVQDEESSSLLTRITSIRRELSKSLGFVISGIRVRDELDLDPHKYIIKIGQVVVAEGILYPKLKLAIPSEHSKEKIGGIEVKDPTFGVDATWIEDEFVKSAKTDDYAIIDPDAVITTHLGQVLRKRAHEILSQDDVQDLLDNLSDIHPKLVESTVPKSISLDVLTVVLKLLLSEMVPITDLRKILEKISSLSAQNLKPEDISELLRPELTPLVLQQFIGVNDALKVLVFAPPLEKILLQSVQQHGSDSLVLDRDLAQSIQRELNEQTERLAAFRVPGVLITAPQIRRAVSKFFRPSLPDLYVFSFSELPDERNIEVFSTVGKQEALEPA